MFFWPVIFFPSFFPVDERTALLVKKPPAPGMPLGLVYKEVVAEYKTESTAALSRGSSVLVFLADCLIPQRLPSRQASDPGASEGR